MTLQYPTDYFPPANCNCGPESMEHRLIPDHILGLSVKAACCIHDYMYDVGKTEADRNYADNIFIQNLRYLIRKGSANWLMRWLRNRKAEAYYHAVKKLGGRYYWKGKRREVIATAELRSAFKLIE